MRSKVRVDLRAPTLELLRLEDDVSRMDGLWTFNPLVNVLVCPAETHGVLMESQL